MMNKIMGSFTMEKPMNFINYLDAVKPEIDARIKVIAKAGGVGKDAIPLLLKGKRLRGGLLMLMHQSTGMKGKYDDVLDLACAIELAHSASLILDDMIDEDDTRRGLTALHITRGHKKAMLETIGILSLPYDLASRSGTAYVKMLADTQRVMVSGAIKELFSNPKLPASKIYDMIIAYKTGRLFSLAAEWGYMAGTGYEGTDGAAAAAKYGMHCGKAMQIADDITDLYEIMDGKKSSNFGSEILLLSCVGIDGLAKEFIHDLKNGTLDFSKVKKLKHTIHNTLVSMHDSEIEKATKCVLEISHMIDNAGSQNKERLIAAPLDIVRSMKGDFHGK